MYACILNIKMRGVKSNHTIILYHIYIYIYYYIYNYIYNYIIIYKLECVHLLLQLFCIF